MEGPFTSHFRAITQFKDRLVFSLWTIHFEPLNGFRVLWTVHARERPIVQERPTKLLVRKFNSGPLVTGNYF